LSSADKKNVAVSLQLLASLIKVDTRGKLNRISVLAYQLERQKVGSRRMFFAKYGKHIRQSGDSALAYTNCNVVCINQDFVSNRVENNTENSRLGKEFHGQVFIY